MKILYNNGTTGECPQEQELHVIRHTAAHILAQAVLKLTLIGTLQDDFAQF